jgi:glycosyltransferase involved in cell wall biosynthesis
VGQDPNGLFANRAKQLGIENCVEFLGIVPNSTVVPLMRDSDVVLVPSRHEYPEGFPLTIHHALCARTPMVVSDHPMFKKHLKHNLNAVVFPAGNVNELADRVEGLVKNPDLYYRLSDVAYDSWYQLRLPVKWGELLDRWVADSQLDRQWFLKHSLDSGLYDQVDALQPVAQVGDRKIYTPTYAES